MAVPCNAGFVELVLRAIGSTSDAWTHIALGTGTGQGASDTILDTESSASGLTRHAATMSAATTTVTGDTIQAVCTFISGATATITEAAVFNHATINTGDMLMVGDFTTSASVVSGDTLEVTMQCQIKAS